MTQSMHPPLSYCVCLHGENSVHYSILPRKKECYIRNYQYFLLEDKSFLRMLSVQAMTLLSLCDLAFISMKEKKKQHCLIETTVRSTCSVSGLWKPGCRRVAFRDILSTSYLHLCISIYKWSMTAGLWCCFCMFIGLCFILLQKCDPSVLLSLRFFIYMYACMYVSVCVYLSSFSCLAVISVY